MTVFDCALDPLALAGAGQAWSDDRRSIAELRRRGLVIDEMRLSHTAEVARLQQALLAEKEASLLEMVRLHAEREQLLESIALLEFKVSARATAAAAGDERQQAAAAGNGSSVVTNDNDGLIEDAESVDSIMPQGGWLGQRQRQAPPAQGHYMSRSTRYGGQMEVSTVSSGLPPAVGLSYWAAYAGEKQRQQEAFR